MRRAIAEIQPENDDFGAESTPHMSNGTADSPAAPARVSDPLTEFRPIGALQPIEKIEKAGPAGGDARHPAHRGRLMAVLTSHLPKPSRTPGDQQIARSLPRFSAGWLMNNNSDNCNDTWIREFE